MFLGSEAPGLLGEGGVAAAGGQAPRGQALG